MKTQLSKLATLMTPIPLNKNLGPERHSTKILKRENNKAFITFWDTGWNTHWFPIIMNGQHIDFDSHWTMEIAREKFGHMKFGISCGSQARMENDSRNNL